MTTSLLRITFTGIEGGVSVTPLTGASKKHSRYGCVFFAVIQLAWLSSDKLQECSDIFQRDVKMTKEEFYAKSLELLMQSIEARDAIIQCAKQHGTWKMGLDSNRALFKTLEETYRGKIAELERQARAEGILPESEKAE